MIREERRSHVRGDILFKVKFTVLTREQFQGLYRGENHGALPAILRDKVSDPDDSNGSKDRVLNDWLVNIFLQVDEKLDRILALLTKEDEDRGLLSQGMGVNISGSGMKILSDKALEPGEIIRANFVLSSTPPLFLDVFGEIVSALPVEEGGRPIYHLGVKFIDLKLNDRENIISRVFQSRREAIRNEKGKARV